MSVIEIVRLLHISAGAAVGAQGCGMDSQGMGRGWMLVLEKLSGCMWAWPGAGQGRRKQGERCGRVRLRKDLKR